MVGRCNNGSEEDCSGVIAVDGEGSLDTIFVLLSLDARRSGGMRGDP